MDLVAVMDKKEITLQCEVCVGGWTRPGDVDSLYTPYGFILSADTPESIVATLTGHTVATDATSRALILRQDGTLVELVSRNEMYRSTTIQLPFPTKGFLSYSPDSSGGPNCMLDYLSSLPGFSDRTGIHTTMDVVNHLKQFHPITGVYTTLKIKKILKELRRRYPDILDMSLENRPRLTKKL